jgi:hypothetical protein
MFLVCFKTFLNGYVLGRNNNRIIEIIIIIIIEIIEIIIEIIIGFIVSLQFIFYNIWAQVFYGL